MTINSINQACDQSSCHFPECRCTGKSISKNRANASHKYRQGMRQLLIDRIEAVAKERKLNKSAVANQIGVSGAQYSRIIHNNGDKTTIDSLLLYLERLGVHMHISFDAMDLNSHQCTTQCNPQSQQQQQRVG